jgi:hypothetical protein
MSILLFRLRNVPDDEANDIRELLNNNNYEFYETSAGNWGISTAAIWLKDKKQLENAKILIEKYQTERGISQRRDYEQLRESGSHKTLFDAFKENPFRFVAYLIFVGFIIYISTKPFLTLTD